MFVLNIYNYDDLVDSYVSESKNTLIDKVKEICEKYEYSEDEIKDVINSISTNDSVGYDYVDVDETNDRFEIYKTTQI